MLTPTQQTQLHALHDCMNAKHMQSFMVEYDSCTHKMLYPVRTCNTWFILIEEYADRFQQLETHQRQIDEAGTSLQRW